MTDVSITSRRKDGVEDGQERGEGSVAQEPLYMLNFKNVFDGLSTAFGLGEPSNLSPKINALTTLKTDDLLAQAVAPYIKEDISYSTPVPEWRRLYDVGRVLAEIRESRVWSQFVAEHPSTDPASWIPGLAERVLTDTDLEEDSGRIVLTLAENLDSPWARRTLARLSLQFPEPHICIPAFIALAGRDEQAAKKILPDMWPSLTDGMRDWLLAELYPGQAVDQKTFANKLPDSIEPFGIYKPVTPESSYPASAEPFLIALDSARRALFVQFGLTGHPLDYPLDNEKSVANQNNRLY